MKHYIGIVDVTSKVEMEKILLTAKVMEMDDDRIAKRLLVPMMLKEVPGYCSHTKVLLKKYDTSLEQMHIVDNKRKFMKAKVVGYEYEMLIKSMMKGSKTDALVMNYKYDGKMKTYLHDLPFKQSRIIFIFRSRMFPTRVNFPKRWSASLNCIYCDRLDTDEHLFECWGYVDILDGVSIDYRMFYHLNVNMELLGCGASTLERMFERLSDAQKDKDLGSDN